MSTNEGGRGRGRGRGEGAEREISWESPRVSKNEVDLFTPPFFFRLFLVLEFVTFTRVWVNEMSGICIFSILVSRVGIL